MRSRYRKTATISAELSNLQIEDNKLRTDCLREALRRLGADIRTFEGCYKGSVETSFMVALEGSVTLQTIVNLAQEYNQESILTIDEELNTTLLYMDGRVENLGLYQEVKEWNKGDCYSKCLKTGKLFKAGA